MTLDETQFDFLKGSCLRTFGNEKGALLFRKTEAIYQQLLDNSDDRGSAAIGEHLAQSLFPPMAYYKALCAQGFAQEKALELVRKQTAQAAEQQRLEMQKLAKLPFAYTIFRKGAKKHMKKNFPDQGWQTEWVRCDGKEVHFNLSKCLYWELCQAYGCPELCSVYCEKDHIIFSGLAPKLRFERRYTLAEGDDYCDFRFFKG